MSVLGELNELLKQIPVWRELVTLPARVRAIEERLGVNGVPATDDRPVCQFCRKGRVDLIDEQPDPTFGAVGVMRQTLKCDNTACARTTTRQRDP